MIEATVIGIFCYNRANKLKTSVEALLKNPEASSLEVIFFCDGPKGEHDKDKVMETRTYIDSVTGFKKVHKQFREKNLTTGPNFQIALQFLCTNYKQFIVVEDDVIVTSNYLKYMLDALDFYRQEKSVFCITGFCFPVNKSNYPFDTIVFSRFSSYGWASWSNRVENVIWDKKLLSGLISNSPGFKRRLNSEGYDLFRMLKKQLNGTISTWDIQMQVYVSETHSKVIYPTISKTSNIGFDNESTNTFGVNYLRTPQDQGVKREFNFCNIEVIEPSLVVQLRKPYRLPALAKRKIINTVIKLLK